MKQLKNIEFEKALKLEDEVEYLAGQIVSKTLCQDSRHSMTLFAFDKGEEISAHESNGDAMVTVLDGEAELTIGGKKHKALAGETIIMPQKVPHAVFATERFKMLLLVLFPPKTDA